MAGNANSGRRPYKEELDGIKDISELSVKTIKALLNKTDLTIDQQLKLALPIVLKRMPDKIEVDDINAISYDDKLSIIASIKHALLGQKPNVIDIPKD